VGWHVFRKPGNVTEDRVPAACDEERTKLGFRILYQFQSLSKQSGVAELICISTLGCVYWCLFVKLLEISVRFRVRVRVRVWIVWYMDAPTVRRQRGSAVLTIA